MEKAEEVNQTDINRSIYNFMRGYCADTQDGYAYSFMGKNYRRSQSMADIESFAAYLLKSGLQKGESVCVCLPNMPQAVIALYGINLAGGVVNVVHPLINPLGLQKILIDTKSRYLLVPDHFYGKYADALQSVPLEKVILCSLSQYAPRLKGAAIKAIYFNKSRTARKLEKQGKALNFQDAKADASGVVFPEVCGSDAAAYMHSGGTSGNSKTIVLSNLAINELPNCLFPSVAEGENGYKYSPSDTMYATLPLFHGYGLGVCVHSSMCGHIKIALVPRFSAKATAKIIKREKVTVMAAIPRMYQKLLHTKNFRGKAIVSLRNAYCGSDKMPMELKTAFDKHMRQNNCNCVLQEGYGLTETVTVCVLNTNARFKDNSMGYPLKGVKAAAFDSTGNKLNGGEKGEICLSTSLMMTEYLNDAAETEKTFFEFNGERWLHTGDLGYVDDEGFVFFIDRLKRLIKISGVNVFPAEIEGVAEQLDFVEKACAVKDNFENKPVIVLYFTLKSDAKFDEKNRAEMDAYLKEHLMKWAIPTFCIALENMPSTAVGKVNYRVLENRMQKGDKLESQKLLGTSKIDPNRAVKKHFDK